MINNQNHDRDQDIRHSHNRNQCRSHLHNTGTSAQQTPSGNHCQNTSNDPWRPLYIIKCKSGKCGLQIVRCKHVKSKCISRNHRDAENNCQRSAVKSCFYIISRTSITFPVFSFFLKYLCQCTFYKCRCTANDRDHPHPEYGAESPDTDCSRHANNITGSYPRCGRYHQRLKG